MARIWGSIFPLVYFFLFAGLVRQYNVEFTPVIYWAFIGGIILSSAIGIYLDGRMPGRSVAVFGTFTFLWLLGGIRYQPQSNAYVIVGLFLSFLLSFIMQRMGRG